MRGWTPDGHEVELVPWQEEAVRAMLGWDNVHSVTLPQRGRQGGKSIVIATVARYDAARSQGRPLHDDPRLEAADG